jgi:hypothetical protein
MKRKDRYEKQIRAGLLVLARIIAREELKKQFKEKEPFIAYSTEKQFFPQSYMISK